MRFGLAVGLTLSVGCGPAIATSSGTDGDEGTADGSGGTVTDGGGPGTGSSSSATTGEVTSEGVDDSSGAGSSSTGEPVEPPNPRWCWSSTWTDARPVSALWMDEDHALAAAESSVLTYEGGVWTQRTLEAPLPEVWMLAARAFDDAWFGHPFEDRLLHFDGETFEALALPLTEGRLLSLVLDPDGLPWVLMRPDPECGGIGPCEEEPAQLHRYDGAAWIERAGADWAERIDAAAGTLWATGPSGEIAHAEFGGAWTFIESPLDGVSRFEAVSPTEFWATRSNTYAHYAGGTWSEGSVSHLRAMTATADGSSWWVLKSPGDDDGTLGRRDAAGWETLAVVPDVQALSVHEGQDALLAIPGAGTYVHRVSDLAAVPQVSAEFGLDDVGDFTAMFVPRAGEVLGMRAWGLDSRDLRLVGGEWSNLEVNASSSWGLSADALWVVLSGSRTLARIEGAQVLDVDIGVGGPRLAAVWGTAEDDVYVCGAPTVGSAGVSNELLVMHWDGASWEDISPPDVQNIGDSSYLDLHGADGHLYVKTALRVYDYDGAGWDSSFSPDGETELRTVRAYSSQAVFVIDENDTLLVHDGETWSGAAGVWPQLQGLRGRANLHGSSQAGIYLSLIDPEREEPDQLWAFDGEDFEPVELPPGARPGATVGVAEDGSQLWLEDGRRVWTAVPCE